MTAEEARIISKEKSNIVLGSIYEIIKEAAEEGKRNASFDISGYDDGFVKATILHTLEDKGYAVKFSQNYGIKQLNIIW